VRIICAKFEQGCSRAALDTGSRLTPTVVVEAVHARFICDAEAAVAVKFAGAVGGVVSGGAGVLALAVLE